MPSRGRSGPILLLRCLSRRRSAAMLVVFSLAAEPPGGAGRPRRARGVNPEPAVLPQEVLDGRPGPVAVPPLGAEAERPRPPRTRVCVCHAAAAVACSATAAAEAILVVIAPRLGAHALGAEPEVAVPRGVAAAAPVAAAAGEDGGIRVVVGPCAAARRRGAENGPSSPPARVARGEGLGPSGVWCGRRRNANGRERRWRIMLLAQRGTRAC